jgi:Domain of unknown function (DUF5666)
MRMKPVALVLAMLLTAPAALAHHTEEHRSYTGTITEVRDGGFKMKTAEGNEMTIRTTSKTVFMPERSALAAGARVEVKMMADGKTAATVRVSAPAAPPHD